MATALKSRAGRVHLLAKNARIIRDAAFTRLVESIQQNPEFLMVRGVVVWQVPTVLPLAEGEKSPFTGQEGQLVVIGGNQRCKAFMSLGMTEIKDDWLIEAKDAQGNWWSPEKAERFVLMDNNPEGIAGENDVRKMFDSFSVKAMQLSGIDFSSMREMFDKKPEADPKDQVSDEVEKEEFGEKDPQLKEFIEHREQTRKDLKEIDEAGFHLLVVFESFEAKAEFLSKSGMTGEDGRVATNGDVYADLVFESYAQKMEFCEKAGLTEEPPEDGSPCLVYGMFADGRALAKRFGIELKESGLHFRDGRLDSQLADMAREDAPQKSEGEQQEEQYAAERRASAKQQPSPKPAAKKAKGGAK